ncbi:MAG: response regulator [Pseudomonadota bacterium]
MNLLIVDDHDENLYFLESLFGASGHRVFRAQDGSQALGVLRENGVDLIISDILMPVMDGFQLCRKVKMDPELRHIPFIIYTATYTGSKDQEFALRIGADRFIEKPCEPDVLLAAVAGVMDAAVRPGEAPAREPLPEPEALKLYSERLVRKLEQKMLEAEQEIQRRQEAEQALLSGRERLIAAQRIAKMGDFTWDLETGEITWSEVLFELLGFERTGEFDYPGITETLLHPDDREGIRTWVRQCLVSGREELDPAEFRVIRQSGQVIWVRTVGVIRTRPGKKPVIFATIQDITQRRQAENAWQESQWRFRLFTEAAPVGVVIADKDQKAVYASRKFVELFGYDREDIPDVEAWFLRAYPDEILRARVCEEWGEEVARARRTLTEIRPLEYPVTCRDGSVKEIEFRMSTNGDLDFIVFTDITARKALDREQDKLKAQLHHAQKLETVGRLAGGVAHDYNNMLSVIIGYGEMARDRVDPSDPLHGDLEEILSAARRSAGITRQLLAFARKQTIAPRVLSLNDAIEGTLKMLRKLIGEDIDLAWLPGADPGEVKMDPSQIDQILANLVVNARDAIHGVGKITIQTGRACFDAAYCADHAGTVPGDFILLAVSDDGSGMDPATLDRIFEPFFTTKGPGEGTGLGLSTVYGIVRQNNGFITVYSEPGKGTIFRIYLPRHAGQSRDLSLEQAPKIPAGHGETVLVVEDDASILKLAGRILTGLGYTVLTAPSPEKALELVHDGIIHLLVTDVVMPEMNGRDLALKLQARHPGLGVLFMSGYTADVIARGNELDPGVCFMPKPFSKQDLAVKVREALEKAGRSVRQVQ